MEIVKNMKPKYEYYQIEGYSNKTWTCTLGYSYLRLKVGASEAYSYYFPQHSFIPPAPGEKFIYEDGGYYKIDITIAEDEEVPEKYKVIKELTEDEFYDIVNRNKLLEL